MISYIQTRITPLNEEEPDANFSASTVIGVIGSKYKPISIEITIQEFESIFEQSIKKYFDAYIKRA